MFRRSIYKTPEQLRLMRAPGLLTAASLAAVRDAIRPGVSTLELDVIADRVIREGGGESNFQKVPGYRHTICVSVNDEVVHGMPGARVLQAGDIVSVDSGADVGGWNGDSAFTVVIDDPTRPDVVSERRTLSEVTEQALWAGIAALASAKHLGEVGEAIEDAIEARGPYGIIEEYTGHGIGRSMHEPPTVFNYATRPNGPRVAPGLVVAIEPMVTLGTIETVVADDGWTVSTTDGTAAAHWEHSVAVHDEGIWVTTSTDGGAAALAPFGVVPVPIP
jgi:methionyl aminopeptidase